MESRYEMELQEAPEFAQHQNSQRVDDETERPQECRCGYQTVDYEEQEHRINQLIDNYEKV